MDRAVAASSSSIVITDPTQPDNPIIHVNPAFERITGYSAEEVLGRNCRFLQGEDREQTGLDELRAAIRAGRECRVVLCNYRKDGERFFNELHVSPVHDESGALIGFVGVQNDVTGRWEANEERERLLSREQAARSEAVAARERWSLLAASGPVLSSSLDYSETLEKITRLFVPALADWCLVDTARDDGTVRQSAEAHTDPAKARLLAELRERRAFEPGSRLARDVLQMEYPVFVEEVEEALLPGGSDPLLRGLESRSCLRVPLLARERTLGVVTLVSGEENHYGEEDVALVEGLANRCALALDNARLYGERGYIARTLQRSLLPHLPETRGVEVGAAYRPVGEESEIGGDFYDLIPAPHNQKSRNREGWIAVAGDVCGKGVVAAATTALIRYTARAVALREKSPSTILAALNEAMLRELSDHRFCTAACLLLEPAERGLDLTLARGGHPPPLLLRANGSAGGSVEKLDPPGKAIGIFPDLDFGEQTARLEAGDAILLYTDGVTEARSPDGAFFGEERVLSLLRSCAGLEAPDIADKVLGAVLEHSQENLRDDLAILVLRAPDKD